MKALLAILLAGLLSACAGGPGSDIDIITQADADRALAIAESSGDKLGAACAAYWVTHADDPKPSIEPVGPLSAYMSVRAVRRKVEDGVSDELMLACGPVVMDSRSTVRRILMRRVLPIPIP